MKLEDRHSHGGIYDPRRDITEARRPTPAEREVIDLLALDPPHHRSVRLSVSEWERVDAVAEALNEARSR